MKKWEGFYWENKKGWFGISIDRQLDESVGFGISLYGHRHLRAVDRWHIHICIDFIAWFFQLQFGADAPKGE